MVKKNKYHNKKVEIDGHIFDSTMEAEFYKHLLNLKEQGEVLEIELQPVFILQEKFKYKGKTIREIKYISDFKVTYLNGNTIIYDVKGMPPTQDFKIKFKMVKYLNRELDFRCVRSKGRTPNKIWEEFL